ncbi:hypothetical protein V6N11_031077 [Hibiscus sabdariffa]|uniref:Uncharacterized protein n=2 Tax=Hibiscus sabdariffa TaxID=183260 RepID=A0ABR1ZWE1_9ROSI
MGQANQADWMRDSKAQKGSKFPGLAVSIDRVSRVRIVLNGDSNNGIPKQWPTFSFTAISIDEAEFMASLNFARALSEKTVDQVWSEIQQGEKRRYGEEKDRKREPMLGETTLEDFLVRLSPNPSIGTLSDTPMTGRKRDAEDAFEKCIERRLRRKIKNRESAARSRARKQAYHNELVNKVSRLEEENVKLKREKEFDIKFQCETSEPKYQHRRTSSAIF